MSAPPLLVTDLAKRFGNRPVLEGLCLEVGPAEVVRISGPNGAGKSTLLTCIAGTLIPDRGRIAIAGHDLEGAPLLARAALRYLPQASPSPRGVSGRELLEFYGKVYGASPAEVDHVAAGCGLEGSLEALVTSYSGGMKRRLMFNALRFGRPALVILDEPVAGVDRSGRRAFRAQLDRWRSDGAAVLLTTHEPTDHTFEALPMRVVELDAP
jgi:ABC-2 type transport system ATP-binding protein